ncbi:hypothetical protein Tco_1177065 [Tanacetum coccineum]
MCSPGYSSPKPSSAAVEYVYLSAAQLPIKRVPAKSIQDAITCTCPSTAKTLGPISPLEISAVTSVSLT